MADKTEAAEASLTAEEIAELKKKATERDQYLDLAQRTRAEFDNYQKRNRTERDQERKYAYGPLARDLLPVIDNLQRALDAARRAGDSGPLVQGVAMVETQFLELLKRNGIVSIEISIAGCIKSLSKINWSGLTACFKILYSSYVLRLNGAQSHSKFPKLARDLLELFSNGRLRVF